MGNFEWIVAGLTIFVTVASVACSVILPVLILGGVGYFIYKRSQQSGVARQFAQTWPTTAGTVLMSSVQSDHSNDYPVVVYQYQVHGKSYQSQTIKAGEQFLNVRIMGQAQAVVARYPIGTSVMVYYNPANPAESALER